MTLHKTNLLSQGAPNAILYLLFRVQVTSPADGLRLGSDRFLDTVHQLLESTAQPVQGASKRPKGVIKFKPLGHTIKVGLPAAGSEPALSVQRDVDALVVEAQLWMGADLLLCSLSRVVSFSVKGYGCGME
jgi:hypothetical protein